MEGAKREPGLPSGIEGPNKTKEGCFAPHPTSMAPDPAQEPDRSSRMLLILIAVIIAIGFAAFVILRPTSGVPRPPNPAAPTQSQ